MVIEKLHGLGLRIRSLKNDTPPNIDIGCQALLLYFVVLQKGIWIQALKLNYPFLPFIGVIDYLPNSYFYYSSICMLAVAFPAILVGYKQRLFSCIMGLHFLLIILSSKPIYSTNLLFSTCLLILIGFSYEKNWVFRLQISVLYFGAAINKMLSIDWWNGRYFLNLSEMFDMPFFEFMSSVMDRMLLAQVFGIGTIAIELALALLFLIPRAKFYGIFLGLFFHTGILVLTKGQLSFIYFYTMFTAYILSPNVDNLEVHAWCPKHTFFYLLKKIDFFKTVHWHFHLKKEFTVHHGGTEYFNIKALAVLVTHQRIIPYFIFLGMVACNKVIVFLNL